MRRLLAALLIITICSLSLCACGRETEPLGQWQVPEIDTAPVTVTPEPIVQGGFKEPRIIWNDAGEINMANPGVANPPEETVLSHKKTLALFPWSFLPYTLCQTLSLEELSHGVLLSEEGALLENAYVSFRYLDKDKNEDTAITVMAELISHERQVAIYDHSAYPHFSYPQGTSPKLSRFGLESFLLHRCGSYRYAQLLLPMPKSVQSEYGILLTIGSGLQVADETLVDVVMELWDYQY